MTPDQHAGRAGWIASEVDVKTGLSVPNKLGVAQVHALLAIHGEFAQLARALTLVLAGDHPPVPGQAVNAVMAAEIEENAPLWAGWQPGTWPVYDVLDPRGFRWANLLEGD